MNEVHLVGRVSSKYAVVSAAMSEVAQHVENVAVEASDCIVSFLKVVGGDRGGSLISLHIKRPLLV